MVVEKLYTPAEVAEKLGMSTQTIKRWLRAGTLKGVRVGTRGDWRITEAALDEFVKPGN